VIGRLIEHDTRSVIHVSEQQIMRRKMASLKYSFADTMVQQVYGPYKKTIIAHWQTYISLHLAMSGDRYRSVYHLLAAVKYDFTTIFNKRTLVICKLLLQKHK
jgi:hypothetical protein